MVLFEIWSVGLVQTGHCQSPPPGCPRAIYKLMVNCWYVGSMITDTIMSCVKLVQKLASSYTDSKPHNIHHAHAHRYTHCDTHTHTLSLSLSLSLSTHIQEQGAPESSFICGDLHISQATSCQVTPLESTRFFGLSQSPQIGGEA